MSPAQNKAKPPHTPRKGAISPEAPATLSPLARRRAIPRKPSLPVFSPKKKTPDTLQDGRWVTQPDVSETPVLQEVYKVRDVERGALGHNDTIIGSTRFVTRAEAVKEVSRHRYLRRTVADKQISILRDKGACTTLGGEWPAQGGLDLLSVAKDPMSIAADADRIAVSEYGHHPTDEQYGCADGSIVVVGFV